MLTIIFSWAILFLVIFLIGNLVLKTGLLSFLNIKDDVEWYEHFWIGLAVVFAILQIWSIFLPVDIYSLIFIFFLAGITFFITVKKRIRIPKLNFRFLICAGLILFVISYFASLAVEWPDTYGYHLTIVKWVGMYKAVPGLTNLYTRLGFNSSFFLFASMVDSMFLQYRSSHVALSLMTSVLLIEYLWIFLKSKNNHLKIFASLSLPILIEGVVHSVQVSSLSYDFALLIIILAICIELIKGDRKSVFIAAILSMTLVTVKLSGAVFALIIIVFASYKLVWGESKLIKTFLSLVLAGFILWTPYVIRNIILSGWPLYPLPVLGLNLSWTVPQERVAGLVEIIKAWAISPGSGWHNVVGMPFTKWFPSWLLANSGRTEIRIFIATFILAIFSILLKHFNKKNISNKWGLLTCGIASFASIIYLLFSAPDFRFGAIFFWVFFASIGSFFFVEFSKKISGLEKILVILYIFLMIYVSYPPRVNGEIMLKSIRWDQPGATNEVMIVPKDGSPSFKVYEARINSFCGESPLPCTSEVSNNFKEIIPGDISKGFVPVN